MLQVQVNMLCRWLAKCASHSDPHEDALLFARRLTLYNAISTRRERLTYVPLSASGCHVDCGRRRWLQHILSFVQHN